MCFSLFYNLLIINKKFVVQEISCTRFGQNGARSRYQLLRREIPMGYNPFCQYYRYHSIPQSRSNAPTGPLSLLSQNKEKATIRVHQCYHPENLDEKGKLHSGSLTCDKKLECPFKRLPPKK